MQTVQPRHSKNVFWRWLNRNQTGTITDVCCHGFCHEVGSCYSVADVLLTTKVGVTLKVPLSETFCPRAPTTYKAPS